MRKANEGKNFRASIQSHVKLKHFSKALYCAAKIGSSNLMIETGKDSCTFSSLNHAQSACVKMVFQKHFFRSMSPGKVKCKVNLKLVLLALRSLNSVKECILKIDGAKNEFKIKLTGYSGITKEFRISFEEQDEIPQAEVPKKQMSMISSRSRIFQSKVLDNFATGLHEVSFIPTSNSLMVKSYVDPDMKLQMGPNQKLFHTECKVSEGDFEMFRISPSLHHQTITCPMREVKAVTAFCKDLDFNIVIYLGVPGHPLVMSNSLENDTELFMEVIVSTLEEDPASQQIPMEYGLSQQPQTHPQKSQPEPQLQPQKQPHVRQLEKSERLEQSHIDVEMNDAKTPQNFELKQSQKSQNSLGVSSGGRNRSPSISPTQVSSWPKNSIPSRQSQASDDDANSKYSFDQFPSQHQQQNNVERDGSYHSSNAKRRRLEKESASKRISTRKDGAGQMEMHSDSDSDGSFVAGTPESSNS